MMNDPMDQFYKQASGRGFRGSDFQRASAKAARRARLWRWLRWPVYALMLMAFLLACRIWSNP